MSEDGMAEEKYLQRLAMAQAAAHWWRRTLEEGRAPSLVFDAGYISSEGNLKAGMFGDGLIGLIRKRHKPITPEQYDLFEWALGLYVVHAEYVRLCTDYHPCKPIYDAGEAAGIDMENYDLRFPFKVYMRVEEDVVQVSAGYRAELTPLVETKRSVIYRQVFEQLSKLTHPPEGDNDYNSPAWQRDKACRDRAYNACKSLPLFPAGTVEKLVDMLLLYALGESNLQPLAVVAP